MIFQLPGISVPVDQLLIEKSDAERLRLDLAAKITPDMLLAASAAAATAGASKPKYGAMRASELLKKFFAAKAGDWGPATKSFRATRLVVR